MAHLLCCWHMILMIFVAAMGFAHHIRPLHSHMQLNTLAVTNSGKTAALGNGCTTGALQQSSKCGSLISRRSTTTACTFRQQVAQTVLDHVAIPEQPANHGISTSSSIRTRRQLHAISTAHQPPRHAKLCSKSKSKQLVDAVHYNQSMGVAEQPLRRFIHHLPSPPVPAAWLDACAAISTAGLSGLQAQLDAHKCVLPDVQQSSAAHCQLGRQPWAYTFADPALSVFVSSLFLSIAQGWDSKQLGAAAPQLNRFDLFHGHIFIANDCNSTATAPWNHKTTQNSSSLQYSSMYSSTHSTGSSSSSIIISAEHDKHTTRSSSGGRGGCRVGVLFHASEYPAYDESSFPVMLGHCQAGSSCRYHQRAMDLRNLLWWQVRPAGGRQGRASWLSLMLVRPARCMTCCCMKALSL